MLVLGIETSCDETAAAVVRDGREIVSSVIASQIETHKRFGGVVPEIASREHLDKIVPIVTEAFTHAGIEPKDVMAAATYQSADVLHVSDQMRVDVGEPANLVVFRGLTQSLLESIHACARDRNVM